MRMYWLIEKCFIVPINVHMVPFIEVTFVFIYLQCSDKSDKTNKQSGENYIKTDSNNNTSYSKPQQTCLSADI